MTIDEAHPLTPYFNPAYWAEPAADPSAPINLQTLPQMPPLYSSSSATWYAATVLRGVMGGRLFHAETYPLAGEVDVAALGKSIFTVHRELLYWGPSFDPPGEEVYSQQPLPLRFKTNAKELRYLRYGPSGDDITASYISGAHFVITGSLKRGRAFAVARRIPPESDPFEDFIGHLNYQRQSRDYQVTYHLAQPFNLPVPVGQTTYQHNEKYGFNYVSRTSLIRRMLLVDPDGNDKGLKRRQISVRELLARASVRRALPYNT